MPSKDDANLSLCFNPKQQCNLNLQIPNAERPLQFRGQWLYSKQDWTFYPYSAALCKVAFIMHCVADIS